MRLESSTFVLVAAGRIPGEARHGRARRSGAGIVGPRERRRKGVRGGGAPRISYAATSTLIWRGLASSRNGRRTVSTPLLYSAEILAASTDGESENERLNAP